MAAVDGLWTMGVGPVYDYAFYGLAAGRYKVEFHNDGLGWLPEFYNDKRTIDEADVIVYDGATPRTGIDGTFDPAPVSIGGTVHSAGPTDGLQVTLYRQFDWGWTVVDTRYTMVAGPEYEYGFYGLDPGNYKVGFENWPYGCLPEFYNDKRTLDEGDAVVYDGTTSEPGLTAPSIRFHRTTGRRLLAFYREGISNWDGRDGTTRPHPTGPRHSNSRYSRPTSRSTVARRPGDDEWKASMTSATGNRGRRTSWSQWHAQSSRAGWKCSFEHSRAGSSLLRPCILVTTRLWRVLPGPRTLLVGHHQGSSS